MTNEKTEFNPKIIAFVCNWCTYAGADLAGTSRMKYAPNVRVIRLPCTGRIDFMFLVKAFENGADGVIVSGCHPNDCHYTAGNFHARRRWMSFRALMEFTGIETERITFSWVSAAEGNRWAELVNMVTEKIYKLGPYNNFKKMLNTKLEEEV
jgi:F420-non-reducing hydrogenase iron-sulfur subunit